VDVREAWAALGGSFDDSLARAMRESGPSARADSLASSLDAARKMAKRAMAAAHPDRNPGDPGAADRFRAVGDALSTIEADAGATIEALRAAASRPPEEPRDGLIVFR